MAWYDKNYRCHCMYDYLRPIVICVKVEYPRGMHQQRCVFEYPIIFGECVFCKCDRKNNRTVCERNASCGKDIGNIRFHLKI